MNVKHMINDHIRLWKDKAGFTEMPFVAMFWGLTSIVK